MAIHAYDEAFAEHARRSQHQRMHVASLRAPAPPRTSPDCGGRDGSCRLRARTSIICPPG